MDTAASSRTVDVALPTLSFNREGAEYVACRSLPYLKIYSPNDCACKSNKAIEAAEANCITALAQQEEIVLQSSRQHLERDPDFEKHLAAWARVSDQLHELRWQAEPTLSVRSVPTTPQLPVSQMRSSLLRFEVKPADIVELTVDFEDMSNWFWEAEQSEAGVEGMMSDGSYFPCSALQSLQYADASRCIIRALAYHCRPLVASCGRSSSLSQEARPSYTCDLHRPRCAKSTA